MIVCRRLLWRWGLLAAVAALSPQATQAAEENEEGFQTIFDGRTLKGWDGDPERWSVQDGAITGRSTAENPLKGNTFIIWTGGKLRDFVLRVKFRIGDQGNSGIQYRSRRVEQPGTWVVGGYQADIDTSGRYLGIVYDERGDRGILAEVGQAVSLLPEKKKAVEKFGERSEILKGIENNQWHEYEITATGNHLTQKIDGRLTVDVTDEDPKRRAAEGILAFQLHTGPPMQVQFKDVRVKHLGRNQDGGQDDGSQDDGSQDDGDEEDAAAASDTAADFERQPDGVSVRRGFRAQRIYEVPSETQGSWVSLTVDHRGRLLASDQYGKLYRVTPPPVGSDGEEVAKVEPLAVDIGRAHGLLYAFDSLYVAVNERGPYRAGLYRVRDTDNDDQYDLVEQLAEFGSGGEHGLHAIIPAPDGKSLYLCGGNHCPMPRLTSSRVPQHWDEDLLLPRMWDATGHARGRLAPGGWICRTDPDGKQFELVSVGYRNEYDIALNAEGELFTYDADMEWDIGAPWYRPTRVCHATSGSEFGWRSGTGKWPEYFPDNLPSAVDVGPGSPTGIAFGYGAAFPEKYQRALYLCDWSYGVIYAAHLEPFGSTYRATLERFVAAAPLPATDIVVNPHDRALYFTVGGRRVQSALYRVIYQGEAPAEPIASAAGDNAEAAALRQTRRALEALQVPGADAAVAKAWPYLAHPDRFMRYAARIAIEHQPVDQWQHRAVAETDPDARITAVIALARCAPASPELQHTMVRRLTELNFDALSTEQQLALLRALSLCIIRLGEPSAATADEIVGYLNDRYPAHDRYLNWELCRLLVRLEAPGVVPRTLDLLFAPSSQESQIHYALCLRTLRAGWTLEERLQYLGWFHEAAAHRGGHSFIGFLRNIRSEAIENMSDFEQDQLAKEIANVPQPVDPVAELEARSHVQKWSVADLAASVQAMEGGYDYELGRRLFAVAQCFKCHRVGGEGGGIGPDLTGAGRRFNAEDLLTAVIEPDKVISDQYQQTTFIVNGEAITGRVVNLGGDHINVNVDFFNNDRQVRVRRQEIDAQFPAETSAMPSGLLDTFTKKEVLELMAYLKSGGDPNHELFERRD